MLKDPNILLIINFSLILFATCQSSSSSSIQSEIPKPHENVDQIEDIEIEQTQIIITTTKEGPVEHLKIHIELVDIEANKKVNPVDLAGLWLTITRGRYTIPFLRPDTWYGIRFRSENQINGHTVIHEDERLIKTKAREEYSVQNGQNNLGMAIGAFITPTFAPIGFPPTIGVPNNINHLGAGAKGGLSAPNPHVGNFGAPNAPSNSYSIPSAPNSPLSPPNHPNDHLLPGNLLPNQQSGHQSKEVQNQDHEQNNAIDVKMHRSLDGVENFESVYVTVSWKKDASESSRSNLTTGVVKLRVICEHSETKEEIRLKGDEDAVTIEITMDQKYDIEEMDAAKHQIKAIISPLKCHKICWTSSLVLSSGFGDFTKHLGEECSEISGTTSTTFLRNVKKVSVIENNLSENELVVETEVAESEYGIVTLLLQKLGGNATEEPIKKTFDTATSNGRFIVPVEDDAIYAVNYEYTKTKPFHYTSKTHFLVESPSVNSSKSSFPLVELSVIPTSFDYKHDKKDSALKPEPPFLLIARSPHYSQNDLLVKIEPFCNESAIKFRLEDRYPQHQIDAVGFLCGLEPKMYFCDKNTTYHKCDSMLCFSTSVLIGLDSFDQDTRCLNVTQHFPPLHSFSASPLLLCSFLFSIILIFSI